MGKPFRRNPIRNELVKLFRAAGESFNTLIICDQYMPEVAHHSLICDIANNCANMESFCICSVWRKLFWIKQFGPRLKSLEIANMTKLENVSLLVKSDACWHSRIVRPKEDHLNSLSCAFHHFALVLQSSFLLQIVEFLTHSFQPQILFDGRRTHGLLNAWIIWSS